MMIGRRAVAALAVGAGFLLPARPARAEDIKIVSDKEGFGTKAAKTGDLLLVNYVATIGDGTMVDTTLGGEKYFTNGTQQSVQPAAARPVIVKVNDLITPVPGQPKGLKIGVEGMRVGGVRTFEVPECFGGAAVRSYESIAEGARLMHFAGFPGVDKITGLCHSPATGTYWASGGVGHGRGRVHVLDPRSPLDVTKYIDGVCGFGKYVLPARLPKERLNASCPHSGLTNVYSKTSSPAHPRRLPAHGASSSHSTRPHIPHTR